MAERKITVIPATIDASTRMDLRSYKKRRVAAYARVSTDSDEQFNSFEAQIDYYTRYINSNPLWTMVEVYSDEGISGTNTKNRDGFNRMIEDALAGKIDLIVTKSISRFARNTVDSLTTIRKLKEHNVECYFEKENIYTFDSKGELLITIMSSIAQEESRSISENVTWGKRKAAEKGIVQFAWNNFLGYRKGEDGKPEIVPEEAEIVKLIYNKYLFEGLSSTEIAKELTQRGIPTPQGKKEWQTGVVINILKNEKYKGDALLQKTFCESYLTHKMVKNRGQVQQYYVKDSHPAIIDETTWGMVQEEMATRGGQRRNLNNKNPFLMKLRCAECGCHYGAQTWHSGTPNQKKMLVCHGRKTGETKCKSSGLSQAYVEKAFLISFKEIYGDKEKIKKSIFNKVESLKSDNILQAKIEGLTKRRAALEKDLKKYQDRYGEQAYRDSYVSGKMFEMYDELQEIGKELISSNIELRKKMEEADREKGFAAELSKTQNFDTYNKTVFNIVIKEALVYANKDIEFVFEGGIKYLFKFDSELYDYTKNSGLK